MEINELMNLIVNNGFPVAVSAYLLIRLEKQLSSLSASINKLNTIISAKLGVVVDTDNKSDSSEKSAWLDFELYKYWYNYRYKCTYKLF